MGGRRGWYSSCRWTRGWGGGGNGEVAEREQESKGNKENESVNRRTDHGFSVKLDKVVSESLTFQFLAVGHDEDRGSEPSLGG